MMKILCGIIREYFKIIFIIFLKILKNSNLQIKKKLKILKKIKEKEKELKCRKNNNFKEK